jgi:hypothetical protein
LPAHVVFNVDQLLERFHSAQRELPAQQTKPGPEVDALRFLLEGLVPLTSEEELRVTSAGPA